MIMDSVHTLVLQSVGNTNLLIEALSEMHGHYPRLDYGSQLAKELLYKHRVEEARQVFVSFIHGTDGNLYQSIYRNHLLPYPMDIVKLN